MLGLAHISLHNEKLVITLRKGMPGLAELRLESNGLHELLMPDLMGKKLRQGSAGRIPDSRAAEYQKYVNERYTCLPDLHARLVKYCTDEERAKSWVIQKALDAWLTGKGY